MQFLKETKKDEFKYETAEINGQVIEFEVDYSLGGSGFFGSSTRPRGVYATVRPVTIERYTGLNGEVRTSRVLRLMGNARESGGYVVMKELPRKSSKEIRLAAEFLDEFVGQIANTWMTDLQTARALLIDKSEAYKAKTASKAA